MNKKVSHNEAVAEMYLRMMYGEEYQAILDQELGKRTRLLEAAKKQDAEEKERLKSATVKRVSNSAAWENYVDFILGGNI